MERLRELASAFINFAILPCSYRDVVGRTKGQGQDKNVLINRSRKNANKNKHHRAAADRKQAKGMF